MINRVRVQESEVQKYLYHRCDFTNLFFWMSATLVVFHRSWVETQLYNNVPNKISSSGQLQHFRSGSNLIKGKYFTAQFHAAILMKRLYSRNNWTFHKGNGCLTAVVAVKATATTALLTLLVAN